MTDIKAQLAAMYPAGQPNEFSLTLPKQALAPTSTVADHTTTADTDDDGDAQASITVATDGVPEGDDTVADAADGDQEPEPQPEYFVRSHMDQRLTATQFNIKESMRWLTDHATQPQPFQPEDVPPGHYASPDVSDEEYAAAYQRYTGTPYRKRSTTIKSNRPL